MLYRKGNIRVLDQEGSGHLCYWFQWKQRVSLDGHSRSQRNVQFHRRILVQTLFQGTTHSQLVERVASFTILSVLSYCSLSNDGIQTGEEIPLWKQINKDNLTPLTLAATLGKKEMFAHLLEKLKEVKVHLLQIWSSCPKIQWSYGPVSCVLFPLDELDSGSYGAEKRKGALQCIVEQEHVDLLVLSRMVELLRKKWERFAERRFFQVQSAELEASCQQ